MPKITAALLSSFTDDSLKEFHHLLKDTIIPSPVELQANLLIEALTVLELQDQVVLK